MRAGDELYIAMEKGIRAAKVILVCISKEYAASTNCQREINLTADLKKNVIPLILTKNIEMPPKGMATAIAGKLYIDFSVDAAFDGNMVALISEIKKFIQ